MSSILYEASEAAFAWYISSTIARGQLVLHTPTRTHNFPEEQTSKLDGPRVELTVHNPSFFVKCLTSPSDPDLVFAEAYIQGDVSLSTENDLVDFFKLFIINRDKPLPSLPEPFASILSTSASLASLPLRTLSSLIPGNRLLTARRNISAHYDLGNEMFKVFLSKDMTYSCAIFPSLDADLKAADDQPQLNGAIDDPLHDAQIRKLQHIIARADIRPGHRVLEIGSGWGSMALQITRTIPGTTVDTITLSTEQAAHVHELIRQDKLAHGAQGKVNGRAPSTLPVGDRVRVHLMDFRVMPAEWASSFDRVVSVEMVEAIGPDMYETYFGAIDWALKKDTGVGVVQGITLPETRYEKYAKGDDYIRRYVLFPGGHIPAVTQLTSAIVKGSSNRLLVESISNIGPHYARTLREWRRRFSGGFAAIEKALKDKYPKAMNDTPAGQEEIARFRRKWVYYFAYCEAGFTTRVLGDHIFTFTREGNVEYGCQVFV